MSGTVESLNPLTLPLQGSALIEASAGTGKTFTIALLYVRLVLGQNPSQAAEKSESGALDAGLEPPNLLVVTFTEAATRELRDRIRVRLTQAAEVFSDQVDDPDPPPETRLLYQLRDTAWPDSATWPECRRKLLAAAEWMDEAAVSTIHAWCHRMLREHAFDSGNLFELSLETDQSELLDSVVRDYWRTFVYPLGPDVMDEVLGRWKTPEDLRQSLKYLLGSVSDLAAGRTPEAAATEVARLRREESDRLKAYAWASWQEEVIDFLNTAQKEKRLNGVSANTMRKSWDRLLAWVHSDELLPEKQDLKSKGLENQQPHTIADRVSGDVPDHAAFHAIEELLTFAANQPKAHADILRHACHWVAERLEREKQQRAEMGFDDLLTRLDQALQGPRGNALADRIRQQFPAALIDEFQDTDPVQYRIFDRVYNVAGTQADHCLLMIGDPKQAIYGFRGADIHTYLAARRGVAERAWTLGTNFRSSEAMVAAVNRLFRQADSSRSEGAFLFGQGRSSPIPFHPVAAQGTRENWEIESRKPASLTFWALDVTGENRKGETTYPAKGAAETRMAEACASEITRLLTLGQVAGAGFRNRKNPEELRPVQPRDIAILVNTGKEAVIVRKALGRRRIKSVYLSDRESVLTTHEAQEVLTWLRAFAEPHQLSFVRAALATSTLGQTWSELDRLLTDEVALEREIDRFMGYHQRWQGQGVLPALRRFLMDYDVPARLLADPDGERRLTDILHLAEILQQESVSLDGAHALVHHYAQMLRAADDEDEHRILRLESDASLIKVITIHKAKGLEFPLVFLPFGTAVREQNEKQDTVSWHDDNGRLHTVFEPTADDAAAADRERLGEDLRKLYVALTRARFATWVGATAIKGWWQSGLGYLVGGEPEASLDSALRSVAADGSSVVVTGPPTVTEDPYEPPPAADPGPALDPARDVREDWWIASYSAIQYRAVSESTAPGDSVLPPEISFDDAESQNLMEEATLGPADAEPDAPVEEWHAFPRGAGPGTFLHDVLEWCAAQGFGTVSEEPERLRSELVQRCAQRGWSDWAAVLEDWVLRLIRTPLPLAADREGDNGAHLALQDLTTSRAELEFWFASSQVSTGTLDRLVRRHTLAGAARPEVQEDCFNGLLKGFIDLVFVHQGRYYVLDYKSNTLGQDDAAYTLESMQEAMQDKRYDLQYVLYLLALHRLLKARLPDYDYDSHVGGAVYLFLRGIRAPGAGVFFDRPPRELIERLDTLFAGEEQPEETL